MEKDVKLGSVGDLDIKFSGGKARIDLGVSVESAGLKAGAFIEEDAGVLIDKIKVAVEAKLPASLKPAEELAFGLLKNLVMGL